MHTWIQMYMFNHEKIIWWHLRRFKWPKMFYIRQNYYWNIKFHVSAHSWGPTYCKVCHISPVLFNRLLPHCYCCSRRARPLKNFIHSYPYVIRIHEVSVFFIFSSTLRVKIDFLHRTRIFFWIRVRVAMIVDPHIIDR